MISHTSNKEEKNKTSNTTIIRQRRKIKDKKTMNLVSENDEGTELHNLNHRENGHISTYDKDDNHSTGSDFEIVDSRLMEIDLDNNDEEDSLMPNLTIDVTNTTESSFFIALQVFFPFFAAGLGTVAAGLLLDHVQVKIVSVSCIYFFHFFHFQFHQVVSISPINTKIKIVLEKFRCPQLCDVHN